tara:strand:- start:3556 stop:4017 length:462 start_codon:yes stop_codon:yes gene_type:complete
MEHKLNNIWNLWFHNKKNNWKKEGYSKLLQFTYLEEILYLLNNFNKLGGLNNNHFILMRDNILPIWEDELNKYGGCISIKIEINKSKELLNKLIIYIVSEYFNNSLLINGVSICIKNPNYCIIQVWLKKENKVLINNIGKIIDINYLYKNYNL